MDEFLAEKIEGLKCAILVEEAIMAGLQPTKDEWDKRSREDPPTGLQTRIVREWLSARGNAERFRKELAMFEMMAEPTGAKAEIRGGQIVISIAIDALPLILSGAVAAGDLIHHNFKITDAQVFAKELVGALNNENEIGTTPIHLTFDRAMVYAIEQGAEGIEEVTEDEFEAEAARLQQEARDALKAE